MFKSILVILLFLPLLSFGQESFKKSGSSISVADAQEVLDHHNKARKELDIPTLLWSEVLSAYAQAWADSLVANGKCNLIHRQQTDYGENLYMYTSSQSFKPLAASLAWYAEKKDYTYSKIGDASSKKSGHYTQMIWKNTKELGAGMAVCANGGIIVVANYSPAGNYYGEYPY